MTNAWKVTAQSEKGEVTTIIHCDDENEAWIRAERLFTGKVWNGIVQRYPLYETITEDNAALRAENAKLREALKDMLFLFDRNLPESSIGRMRCDDARRALESSNE